MGEPGLGDAFGELMRAALAEETGIGPRPTVGGRLPRSVIEIVERDDGLINGTPAARYLGGPELWEPVEVRALDHLAGRTLDVGTGAGRVALALQDRGVAVVGLDVSSGTAEVAAARGVRATVCASVDEHAASGQKYDRFALFGNNLGLLESRERAPGFLSALAAMANPGARVVAQSMDPYGTRDELHLAYHERNRASGRLGGQLRVRVRYRDIATDWFDYLMCDPAELVALAADSPWCVESIDDADMPFYSAILRLR